MSEPKIEEKLKQIFTNGDRPTDAHRHHLLNMQQSGEWGTEEEIATADIYLSVLSSAYHATTQATICVCSTFRLTS